MDPFLDPMPDKCALKAMIAKIKCPIKALLLDQERIFCGIGNWLADEILYQSGIHPETIACKLSEMKLERFLGAMKYVIFKACEVDACSVHFPSDWLFHYRWSKGKSDADGNKLQMPNGARIVFETVGGRTSAIVPSVQKKGGQEEGSVETVEKRGAKKAVEKPNKKPQVNSDAKRKVKVAAKQPVKIKEGVKKRPVAKRIETKEEQIDAKKVVTRSKKKSSGQVADGDDIGVNKTRKRRRSASPIH